MEVDRCEQRIHAVGLSGSLSRHGPAAIHRKRGKILSLCGLSDIPVVSYADDNSRRDGTHHRGDRGLVLTVPN